MPEFPGPHLSPPDRPEADPAVKAVVDIARGHSPSPRWRTATTPTSPKLKSFQEGEINVPVVVENRFNANDHNNSAGNNVIDNRSCSKPSNLTLPTQAVQPTSAAVAGADCCLSPAAHAAGQLTYGIYEGGGVMATPRESRAARTDLELPTPYGRRGCGAAVAAGDRRDLANDDDTSSSGRGRQPHRFLSQEEQVMRRKQAVARLDAELEVALWIEGVTGVTFSGKFWSSLKDGGKKYFQQIFDVQSYIFFQVSSCFCFSLCCLACPSVSTRPVGVQPTRFPLFHSTCFEHEGDDFLLYVFAVAVGD